jgi:hypothetical protein
MTILTIACLTFAAVLLLLGTFAVAAGLLLSTDDEVIDLTDDAEDFVRRMDKDEAECCKAHALPDGRPVIGYCGPDCERRPR